MGGSLSQSRTDPPMSLIHVFSIEDMYMPEFLDSFQENTGSFQEPVREESPVEVATSPPKTKKPTKGWQKRMIQSNYGGSKSYKSSGSSSFNIKSGEASINQNANVGDDDEEEVQEIRRPMGRDKAKDAVKNKGSRALGSSSTNDEAFARLMVTKMASQEKVNKKMGFNH
ncbi:hypothetical protein Tco_0371076 [Tanacetum coccineum]